MNQKKLQYTLMVIFNYILYKNIRIDYYKYNEYIDKSR